jgi:hypothetical protein
MRCNLGSDIRLQYFGELYITTIFNILFLFTNGSLKKCLYKEDTNRDNIDRDKFKNGITDFQSTQEKELLYSFLARYV